MRDVSRNRPGVQGTHRVLRLGLALGVGLAVAFFSYQWISDPRPRQERAMEEAAVLAARDLLRGTIGAKGALQIVDPLAPDRKVGKVYIYPAPVGWEVSGHYRRDAADDWHPFLMQLGEEFDLAGLAVRDDDPDLRARAAADPRLTVKQ